MADEQEKTEEPTSKKIEDAKKEGNVPKSMEVPGAAILFFSSIYLLFFSSNLVETLKKSVQYILSFIGTPFEGKFISTIVYSLMWELLSALTPLFIIIFIMGISFNLIQFGFLTTPIKLDFQKINPINGFKNVFSIKKIIEAIKLFTKLTVIFIVMIFLLFFVWNDILRMMQMGIGSSLETMIILTVYFLAAILFIIILFAIIDFFFTRHYYFKQLKMSKQEIKDEYKQLEGDPQVKGRIRSIQMKMARQRMLQDVADADVIITNPSHYAVALEYNKNEQNAPKIVAKGIDFIALKIKELGKQNNIPIIENPSLARALHDQVEVQEQIPNSFYETVAEIFTYIYQLNKKIPPKD